MKNKISALFNYIIVFLTVISNIVFAQDPLFQKISRMVDSVSSENLSINIEWLQAPAGQVIIGEQLDQPDSALVAAVRIGPALDIFQHSLLAFVELRRGRHRQLNIGVGNVEARPSKRVYLGIRRQRQRGHHDNCGDRRSGKKFQHR